MRVGVTGHSKLTSESVRLVADALRKVLTGYEQPITGVTCLARGADQIFARAVVDVGGRIEVILPSADYREAKVKPENREEFEFFVGRADDVRVMPYESADRDAYAAAGEQLLAGVDHLIAVWDGAAPDGRGGTGDTVQAARSRDLPTTVVWPEGARRAG